MQIWNFLRPKKEAEEKVANGKEEKPKTEHRASLAQLEAREGIWHRLKRRVLKQGPKKFVKTLPPWFVIGLEEQRIAMAVEAYAERHATATESGDEFMTDDDDEWETDDEGNGD